MNRISKKRATLQLLSLAFAKAAAACFWALFILCFSFVKSSAQGWQQHPVFGTYDFARGAFPTPDGGFFIAGHTGNGPDLHDAFLLKTDPFGNEQTRRVFGGPFYEEINDLERTADGGYILVGSTFSFGNGASDVWLVKTDHLGNLEWTKTYGNEALEFGRAVIQTSDGGYALIGRSDNMADVGVFVVKTDGAGNEEWSSVYGGAAEDEGWGIAETADHQLVIVGVTESLGAGGKDIYLAKIALDGAFQWFTTFGGADEELGFSVLAASNGSLLIGGVTKSFGAGASDVFLVSASNDGLFQWQKTYGGALGEWGAYLLEMPAGGYAFAGSAQSFNNLLDDVYLVRIDEEGNELWSKTFGGERIDLPHSLALSPNGGFVIAAHSRIDNAGNIVTSQSYLIHADAQGNAISNYIQGQVFEDPDADCELDAGETGFDGWLLRAVSEDGTKTFFGMTGAGGYYSILTDTGSYDLQLFPPNAYWQPCEDVLSLTFFATDDTLTANFPLQKAFDCPQLEVDVATSIVRPCSTAVYEVVFANHGTATAQNAFVEITLDSFYTFINAGLPVASQNGQVFRFDLGDLAVGQSGGFPIEILLDCAAQLGRTHCMDAHIFPDGICLPPDPSWDGAHIETTAVCVGDSIHIKIKNTGIGGMASPLKSIIVEDQIMTRAVEFQLESLDSIEIVHPAQGKTIRLQTQQSENHPGISRPAVSVEGCGNGNISLGFVTMFPEDDADRFVSKDCRESTASLPPDEKLSFPKGIDAPHWVLPATDIEYLVHFQNTAQDTVFQVVVRDTLSEYLDVTTFRPGASSHPYELIVSNEGILEFTFPQIALPDSATNELASHGFVKFRVSQRPEVPCDSLIVNRSSVSMDFGAPTAFPTAFHTLTKPQIFSISDVSLCMGGFFEGVAFQSDTTFFETISMQGFDSLHFVNIGIGDFGTVTFIDTMILPGAPLNGFMVENDTVIIETFPLGNGCDSVVTWTVDVLTGTDERLPGHSAKAWPVPFSDHFLLEIKLPNVQVLSIEMTDVLGQKSQVGWQEKGRGAWSVFTEGLRPGVYFISIKTNLGEVVLRGAKM